MKCGKPPKSGCDEKPENGNISIIMKITVTYQLFFFSHDICYENHKKTVASWNAINDYSSCAVFLFTKCYLTDKDNQCSKSLVVIIPHFSIDIQM